MNMVDPKRIVFPNKLKRANKLVIPNQLDVANLYPDAENYLMTQDHCFLATQDGHKLLFQPGS